VANVRRICLSGATCIGRATVTTPIRRGRLILPSWQLSTSYGYRIGGGTLPVGGAYVVCDGRGGFEVVKRFTEWPIATYWKEPRE
jgi:hypothetical protein